jgi:hypothetical protein
VADDLETIDEPPQSVPTPSQEQPDRSKARRWVLPALLFVVVAVLATGVTVLVTRDDEASPDELLEAARSHAAEAGHVAFSGRLRIESEDPEGGSGSYVDRVTIRGQARLPDHARYTVEGRGYASEVIALGDLFYTRDAEKVEDLAAKKWAETDLGREDERSGVIRDEEGVQQTDLADPVGLLGTLRAASRPVLVRRNDRTATIRATVDPSKAYSEEAASGVTSVSIELTLADEERIDRAVLTAKGEGGSVIADYQFNDWGKGVQIAAPAPDDRDPTPGLEEEDIAEYGKRTKLYQPRGVPAGWILESAGVLPKQATVEGCDQVEIDYTDPDDPDAGYLYLYLLPKSCADLDAPRGSRPFTAGRYAGYIEEDPSGALAQIVVGDTVVQAETDLPSDGLARILADLIPLNLAIEPVELTGFETTTSA